MYIEPESVFADMLYTGICTLLLTGTFGVCLFLLGQQKNSLMLKISSGLLLLPGFIPIVRAFMN